MRAVAVSLVAPWAHLVLFGCGALRPKAGDSEVVVPNVVVEEHGPVVEAPALPSFAAIVDGLHLGSDPKWEALLDQNQQRTNLSAPDTLREFVMQVAPITVDTGFGVQFPKEGGAVLLWGLTIERGPGRDEVLRDFETALARMGFKRSAKLLDPALPEESFLATREQSEASESVVILFHDSSSDRYQVRFQLASRRDVRRPALQEALDALPHLAAAFVDEQLARALGSAPLLKLHASGRWRGYGTIVVEAQRPFETVRKISARLTELGMHADIALPTIWGARGSPTWFRFSAPEDDAKMPRATLEVVDDSVILGWYFVLDPEREGKP